MVPKVKMVPFNHIKHKPVGSSAFSNDLKILESVPSCTTGEDDCEEVVDCSTSGMPFPSSLLPEVSGTG